MILSQQLGKPVRVQWTLTEDFEWSAVAPAWVADVKAGLDMNGKLVAIQSDFYMTPSSDARMVGAVLAGLPELYRRAGWRHGNVRGAVRVGRSNNPSMPYDIPSWCIAHTTCPALGTIRHQQSGCAAPSCGRQASGRTSLHSNRS